MFYIIRRNYEKIKKYASDILPQVNVFFKVLRVYYSSNNKRNKKDISLYDGDIIVISYYTPPYRSVYGTQRTNKFIKYLSKKNLKFVRF